MRPEELAARLERERLDKQRLMTRIVLTVEAEAKKRTPVKSGTLRRSLTHTVERAGERGTVGTNVVYGLYVHEGTRYMAGRPFLVEGRDASQPMIDRYLREAGEELLRRIAR